MSELNDVLRRPRFDKYLREEERMEFLATLVREAVPVDEDGDPFATSLPPPVHTNEDDESAYMRAVIFVTEGTPKGLLAVHRSMCIRS